MPCVVVFAKAEDSSEIIKGTFSYTSNEGYNRQIENSFEYRDDCFTRSSFLGCHHLEILSSQVAISSASRYGMEEDFYDTNPEENSYNVVKFLNDMKFENVETNKYYTLEKQENSGAVAVGHKTIVASGKEYTLLAIIPRSAGYKQEWAGNFNVGDGDIHRGFKAARDEMLRFVKQYIKENNITGDIKVWTTGHSRGAALANTIGGFFAGGGIDYFEGVVSITPEDVYCYTFATPRTIKNGADKNIELSVAGNRDEEGYQNDTPGAEFNYTKGGTVDIHDEVYNGVRNLISSYDIFPLLPPEVWGFEHYGQFLAANHGVTPEEAVAEELKSVSPYSYNRYITGGNPEMFERKTFDLKTLSVVRDDNEYSAMDMGSLLVERLHGLTYNADTNEAYYEEGYQETLKAVAGVYGMAEKVAKESFSENFELFIKPVVYSYLAYASERLQEEQRAGSEEEAIAIVIEDLVSFFTGEEIVNNSISIDEFFTILVKYIAENEDEKIVEVIISGLADIIPEDYKDMLCTMLANFHKDNTYENPVSLEEALKAYLLACYNGSDPECVAFDTYETASQVRSFLYMMASFILPDSYSLLLDDDYNFTAPADFKELVSLIVPKLLLTVKDENNQVVKIYNSIGELADDSFINALDLVFEDPINMSRDLFGEQYYNALSGHFGKMKDNVTNLRKLLMYSLLYTDDGFNVEMQVKNVATFFGNINIIPLAHYNELYIAYAKAGVNFDCGYESHVKNNIKIPDIGKAKISGTSKELSSNYEGTEILNPETGDNIAIWISLMVVSLIGVVGTIKLVKKEQK